MLHRAPGNQRPYWPAPSSNTLAQGLNQSTLPINKSNFAIISDRRISASYRSDAYLQPRVKFDGQLQGFLVGRKAVSFEDDGVASFGAGTSASRLGRSQSLSQGRWE